MATRAMLLCVAASLTCACSSTPQPDDAALADDAPDAWSAPGPVVPTTHGPVLGFARDGYREFVGIPYAAPPIGDLRWRPPQAPAPWTSPRDATHRPHACQQILENADYGVEDCLYLNVDTPDPAPTGAPVMVWIHGGAFVIGEGLEGDGGTRGNLLAASHGVVVVSMNYRLGQLGFLAHPALDAESTDHVSGNYGFLDQIAALEWVRDNAAAFGGDPANVTLIGESAGGESICGHLTAPRSRGLFQRAILESGPCGLPMHDLTTAEAQGTQLAQLLGCTSGDVAACMRAATAAHVAHTLPTAQTVFSRDPMYAWWGPIVDGHVFATDWMTAILRGHAASVPILAGWNRDEGTMFVSLAEMNGLPPVTAASYRASVAAFVGDAYADQVVAQYPLASFGGDARLALSRAIGDGGLACTSRAAVVALRDAGNPVHAYFFSFADAPFTLATPFPLGAYHGGEIQFVFGHPMGAPFSGAQAALNAAMSGYWTRFASQGGDPDGSGATPWPQFDAAGTRLVLDSTITAGTDDYASACAFWSTIPFP